MDDEMKDKLYQEIWVLAHSKGVSLENGCLPVSLIGLGTVRKIFSDAHVVVGNVALNANGFTTSTLELKSYRRSMGYDARPDFHAWIAVQHEIIDFTLGRTWERILPGYEQRLIDSFAAKNLSIKYKALLIDWGDVSAFGKEICGPDAFSRYIAQQ